MISLSILSTGLLLSIALFAMMVMFIFVLPIYCLYKDSNALSRVPNVTRYNVKGFKP